MLGVDGLRDWLNVWHVRCRLLTVIGRMQTTATVGLHLASPVAELTIATECEIAFERLSLREFTQRPCGGAEVRFTRKEALPGKQSGQGLHKDVCLASNLPGVRMAVEILLMLRVHLLERELLFKDVGLLVFVGLLRLLLLSFR